MNTLLELKNVSYKYNKNYVLKNVNFKIKEATFFVLLGLNGAGKSTIFSLITRLLNLKEGEIYLNSYNLKQYTKALNKVGIVFQEPTLDLDLSVKQNLFFYACLKGVNFKKSFENISSELKTLDLDTKLNIKVRDLNAGHRRRVEILRALITQPSILLLDEASVGLDVKSRFDILSFIRDMVKKRGISVLWITHLFDEVNEKDSVAIIKEGEIIHNDLLKNLLSKHNKNSLSELFLQISSKK